MCSYDVCEGVNVYGVCDVCVVMCIDEREEERCGTSNENEAEAVRCEFGQEEHGVSQICSSPAD